MFKLLATLDNNFGKEFQKMLSDKISELEQTENFDVSLYLSAMIEPNENRQLQLCTWAADLGNKDAINYIHTNKEIPQLLAERLEEDSYYFFKERINFGDCSYSLYMLGMINNVCNNYELPSVKQEKKLAIEFYNKSIERGNPLAMIAMAQLLLCSKKDHSKKIKELVNRASEEYFPIDENLKCYLE